MKTLVHETIKTEHTTNGADDSPYGAETATSSFPGFQTVASSSFA